MDPINNPVSYCQRLGSSDFGVFSSAALFSLVFSAIGNVSSPFMFFDRVDHFKIVKKRVSVDI